MVLAVSLLVACTTSESPQENTDTQEVAQETQKEQPAAKSAAKAAFKAALGTGSFEYQVTYDVAATYGDQSSKLVMTQYFKDAKMRTDSEVSGIQTQAYLVGNVVTSCTRFSGDWMCQETTLQETSMENPSYAARNQAESAAADVKEDDTMQVAGVTADCYLVTTQAGTTRYCVHDNVPLYVKTTTSQGTSEVKARSYSKTVADSVFIPPASASESPAYQLPPGVDIPDY